jgi:hypothetical protein
MNEYSKQYKEKKKENSMRSIGKTTERRKAKPSNVVIALKMSNVAYMLTKTSFRFGKSIPDPKL